MEQKVLRGPIYLCFGSLILRRLKDKTTDVLTRVAKSWISGGKRSEDQTALDVLATGSTVGDSCCSRRCIRMITCR